MGNLVGLTHKKRYATAETATPSVRNTFGRDGTLLQRVLLNQGGHYHDQIDSDFWLIAEAAVRNLKYYRNLGG
jgi:hypothetical protein